MDLFEQFALAGQALSRAATGGIRRGFAIPWGWDFLLHVAVVVLLWNFARPAVSELAAPLLHSLAGGSALHYPAALLALPNALAEAGHRSDWLLLPLFAAWSAAMVGRRMRRQPEGVSSSLGDALARVPTIVPLGAVVVLVRGVCIALAAGALSGLGHRPLMGVATWFAATMGEFALLAIAALLLPLLVVDAPPVMELGWRWSDAWGRAGGAAVGIAVFMGGLGVVSRFAFQRVERMASATPDVIPLLVIAEALVAAAGGALFCVASTIAYGSLVQEPE